MMSNASEGSARVGGCTRTYVLDALSAPLARSKGSTRTLGRPGGRGAHGALKGLGPVDVTAAPSSQDGCRERSVGVSEPVKLAIEVV
jgi:hypothetical protein